MAKEVEWMGSTKCDYCNEEIKDDLYDAKTIYGPWATMCKEHFKKLSCSIGPGKGQHYKKNEQGKFIKVEG